MEKRTVKFGLNMDEMKERGYEQQSKVTEMFMGLYKFRERE